MKTISLITLQFSFSFFCLFSFTCFGLYLWVDVSESLDGILSEETRTETFTIFLTFYMLGLSYHSDVYTSDTHIFSTSHTWVNNIFFSFANLLHVLVVIRFVMKKDRNSDNKHEWEVLFVEGISRSLSWRKNFLVNKLFRQRENLCTHQVVNLFLANFIEFKISPWLHRNMELLKKTSTFILDKFFKFSFLFVTFVWLWLCLKL